MVSAIEAACHAYGRIPVNVLDRCEFRISALTWQMLRLETIATYGHDSGQEEPGLDDRMFGRPVRIDETLAPGVVEAWQRISSQTG